VSLLTMLDSTCVIYRPSSVTRDANQGVVQVFTVLQAGLPCSQQQAGMSKQLVYAQQNAVVNATLYFDDDPGTTANDLIVAISDFTGLTNMYLVTGRAMAVTRGLNAPWNVDCQFIQAPAYPAMVIDPTAADVTDDAATLGGNVADDGDSELLAVGVVWSRTSVNDAPVIGGTGVTNSAAAVATGVFTVAVSGLLAATSYTYRPYTTTRVGTTYGPLGQFETEA
jgi:hypothetical protein